MSVILFDPTEIADAYKQYKGIYQRLKVSGNYPPELADMKQALQAYNFANTMAYCLTYDDWNDDNSGVLQDLALFINEDEQSEFMPGTNQMLLLVRQLKSFNYNAVSNAGTHCLPQKYQDVIDSAILAILEYVSGYYNLAEVGN